jgi:hypothetical protein
MKVVYIGGPYIGNGHFPTILDNIEAARDCAIKLANAGIAFIAPHLNSALFEQISYTTSAYWYNMYLEILSRCDALFMANDWQDSRGCQLEMELALHLNMPIFYWAELESLKKWVKEQESMTRPS